MSAYPYRDKVEAAKRWLGARYLLARPVNRPHRGREVPTMQNLKYPLALLGGAPIIR